MGVRHEFLDVTGMPIRPVVEGSVGSSPAVTTLLWEGRLVTLSTRNGTYALTDRYGVTTTRKLPTSMEGMVMTIGDGAIILSSSTTDTYPWVSTDGVNWERKNYLLRDVSYQDGWFIGKFFKYPGESSSKHGFSRDGVDWIKADGLTGSSTDIAIGNGVFLALINTTLHSSTDGRIWKSTGLAVVRSAIYEKGLFYVVSNGKLLVSPDAVTWVDKTPSVLGLGESLLAVRDAGGRIFALTSQTGNAYRWTSKDEGDSWQAIQGIVPALTVSNTMKEHGRAWPRRVFIFPSTA